MRRAGDRYGEIRLVRVLNRRDSFVRSVLRLVQSQVRDEVASLVVRVTSRERSVERFRRRRCREFTRHRQVRNLRRGLLAVQFRLDFVLRTLRQVRRRRRAFHRRVRRSLDDMVQIARVDQFRVLERRFRRLLIARRLRGGFARVFACGFRSRFARRFRLSVRRERHGRVGVVRIFTGVDEFELSFIRFVQVYVRYDFLSGVGRGVHRESARERQPRISRLGGLRHVRAVLNRSRVLVVEFDFYLVRSVRVEIRKVDLAVELDVARTRHFMVVVRVVGRRHLAYRRFMLLNGELHRHVGVVRVLVGVHLDELAVLLLVQGHVRDDFRSLVLAVVAGEAALNALLRRARNHGVSRLHVLYQRAVLLAVQFRRDLVRSGRVESFEVGVPYERDRVRGLLDVVVVRLVLEISALNRRRRRFLFSRLVGRRLACGFARRFRRGFRRRFACGFRFHRFRSDFHGRFRRIRILDFPYLYVRAVLLLVQRRVRDQFLALELRVGEIVRQGVVPCGRLRGELLLVRLSCDDASRVLVVKVELNLVLRSVRRDVPYRRLALERERSSVLVVRDLMIAVPRIVELERLNRWRVVRLGDSHRAVGVVERVFRRDLDEFSVLVLVQDDLDHDVRSFVTAEVSGELAGPCPCGRRRRRNRFLERTSRDRRGRLLAVQFRRQLVRLSRRQVRQRDVAFQRHGRRSFLDVVVVRLVD